MVSIEPEDTNNTQRRGRWPSCTLLVLCSLNAKVSRFVYASKPECHIEGKDTIQSSTRFDWQTASQIWFASAGDVFLFFCVRGEDREGCKNETIPHVCTHSTYQLFLDPQIIISSSQPHRARKRLGCHCRHCHATPHHAVTAVCVKVAPNCVVHTFPPRCTSLVMATSRSLSWGAESFTASRWACSVISRTARWTSSTDTSHDT